MSELITFLENAIKIAASGPMYWAAAVLAILFVAVFRLWLYWNEVESNEIQSDQQGQIDDQQTNTDGSNAEDELVKDGDAVDKLRDEEQATRNHSFVKGRLLNWRKSREDENDFKYETIEPFTGSLPTRVDLRSRCSPVEDQGQIGSCTGNALVGLLEYLELQNWRKVLDAPELSWDKAQFINLSRLFVYWCERSLEGTQDADTGATTIRDGCKALQKFGVCSERLWPYRDTLVTKKPSEMAFKAAQTHQIKAYYALSGLLAIKRSLANGYPVTCGFSVYESFMSEKVSKTGIMPIPSVYEQVLGGHAVLIVGYDDASQVLICRNSWGKSWGDGGHFYMPYSFAKNPFVCADFFTVR